MQIAQSKLGTLKPPVDTSYTQGVEAGNQSLFAIEGFISQIIGFLTVLASVFFIVYFFMGAFKWVTAGGESGKVQKARDQMIQGVLGLVLIVASYAIIGIIGTIVGIDILLPAQTVIDNNLIPTP